VATEGTTRPAKRTPSRDYGTHVPAADQTVRILQYLARSGDATLTEICGAVGIHLSKGLAILTTLRGTGMVTRADPAKTYALGPGVLTLARSYLDRTSLAAAASPYLHALAEESGTTALLGLVSAGNVVIIAREEAPSGLAVTIRVGHRYPPTWGAHGKAIVAFSSPTRRDELLADGESRFYEPDARPSPTEIETELAEVRSRGFSTDIGGIQPGVSAVSAPLLGADGQPRAVLILVGTFPAGRAVEHGVNVAATARKMNETLLPFLTAGD
jgi:DNA-binding IclR family transcriptional regulator